MNRDGFAVSKLSLRLTVQGKGNEERSLLLVSRKYNILLSVESPS